MCACVGGADHAAKRVTDHMNSFMAQSGAKSFQIFDQLIQMPHVNIGLRACRSGDAPLPDPVSHVNLGESQFAHVNGP